MLQLLNRSDDVESAAKAAAGNWESWDCFMWFGSDEVPDSSNVMLGYVITPNTGVIADANCTTIGRKLAPYLGLAKATAEDWDRDDELKTADYFGSSFHGDHGLLKGYMIRVYTKSGRITEAFKLLYELAKASEGGDLVLDNETLRAEMQKQLMRYYSAEDIKSMLEEAAAQPSLGFTVDQVRSQFIYDVLETVLESEQYDDLLDEDLAMEVLTDLERVVPAD